MFHFVYKTVEPGTGRYYFGKHSTTDLLDGYQGSGRWVTRALRKGRHLVTGVVEFFPSADAALAAEASLVTDEALRDPKCMNQTTGGRGSFHHIHINWTKADSERQAEVAKRAFASYVRPSGSAHVFYGKKRPEHAAAMRGANNPFFGKKHSEETRAAMRARIDPAQRARVAAGNTNTRGRSWWNDGNRNVMAYPEQAAAMGLTKGRLPLRARRGPSEAA